jgi:hypothetical protein
MPPSFMSQFKMKKIKKIDYDNGTSKTDIQVLRKDKKPISLADVKKLTLHYGTHANNNDAKIGIRGMAIDGWKSLKDYKHDILTDAEYDDYYVNKVMDTTKYHSFEQLQLYVHK